ncbi:tumor necrosis factor ligand superfamily member 12 isoform X2 [Hypomesus transpacificus]|uniref:tumor necrosis factor ligand superfamily member 12 isoform X2 n=1 Tax=Hypomesus transpacificus TaxID=137520 RepID=UPI001F085E6C|nr:tumor necrosis factor ligand superfamily member 12 isoform X2 [Hypomesus transpacificus]
MQRVLQRRRASKLRFLWAFMAMVALSLAACSAMLTVWTWRQTRDLSQSFKTLQERLEQVNSQRKAIFQLILEKRELLVGQRVKRDGRSKREKNGNGKKVASHFEITKESYEKVGQDGLIKGWMEDEQLNMSRAVRYSKETGIFTVERAGVYFLYCQVLFNEHQSQYIKLDVEVKGRREQKLQCIEGYGTTPAAGYHQFHFLKPCQVSGLLRLEKGAELKTKTGPDLSLHTGGKHYFSIFKVN